MNKFKVETRKIDFKRIFLISDLHFGVRANSLEWIQNQYNFFVNFYIPFLKQNVQKGDILFILGDWFDNRQLLDIYVMNISVDIMMKLSSILPVHTITGNHDIYKKHDTDVNSLRAFKYIKNVHVYDEPFIASNDNSKILVLPWIGDKEKEESYAKSNKAEYIFAHTDISGFKYDNGRQIVKGARLMNAKGYKRIISGHIHKHQVHDNGRGIYIGSPYHTKRSDIGNDKGVYIFDPDNNKIQFNKNTLSSIFQRINLEDLIEWPLEYAFKVLQNNYSDIVVPDKFVHLFNLTKFIDLLKGCEYKRIETRGEKVRFDESLEGIIDGDEIKDILTLLEMNINDLHHPMETLIKLKVLNKKYYEQSQEIDG